MYQFQTIVSVALLTLLGTACGPPLQTSREPLEHRPAEATCDNQREPGVQPDGDGPGVSCQSDADCTDGDNGRCVGNSHDGWYCTYDKCFEDSHCGDSAVCECGGGFRSDHNVCLTGNCRTDADCGDDGYCSPSMGTCGDYEGIVGYFCHTRKDECIDDADCGDGSDDGWGSPYCMYDSGVGHWRCSTSHCVG